MLCENNLPAMFMVRAYSFNVDIYNLFVSTPLYTDVEVSLLQTRNYASNGCFSIPALLGIEMITVPAKVYLNEYKNIKSDVYVDNKFC